MQTMPNRQHLLYSILTNPVNIFSTILLVSFFLLLMWIAESRLVQFKENHRHIAVKATETAANELEHFSSARKRLLRIFVEDNLEKLTKLAKNPADESVFMEIGGNLKRYFPDFFAFSIATKSGDPIIDDFDGNFGEICVADMKQAAKSGEHLMRVHPNPNRYHVDAMVRFKTDNRYYILLVSFGLKKFAKVLHIASPQKHRLLAIQEKREKLIEFDEVGSRYKIKNRLDYRLNPDEQKRIYASAKVNGTLWNVIDLYDSGLFAGYRARLYGEGAKIYLVFFAIVIVMWTVIIRKEQRRQAVEEKLILKNQLVTQLNRKLENLSITDELTGLYNRRFLNARLNEEWSRAMRSQGVLALAIVDVDFFKQYNDYYGHQAGDQCLKKVAECLAGCIRRSGEIVARYGGEEFVIIMPNTTCYEAKCLIDSLIYTIEQKRMKHEKSSICDHLTVSVGFVCCIPQLEESLEDFFEKADHALYEAKRAGRNTVYQVENGDVADEKSDKSQSPEKGKVQVSR